MPKSDTFFKFSRNSVYMDIQCIIFNDGFRIASGVIDGIIQKCFNSKPKTKEVATEICLQVSKGRVVSSKSSENHNDYSKSIF